MTLSKTVAAAFATFITTGAAMADSATQAKTTPQTADECVLQFIDNKFYENEDKVAVVGQMTTLTYDFDKVTQACEQSTNTKLDYFKDMTEYAQQVYSLKIELK